MNRTEGNSHNTWNITAAALTNLNSSITYKLQRNYTFHDSYSTRLRTATLRRRHIIGRRYRKVSMVWTSLFTTQQQECLRCDVKYSFTLLCIWLKERPCCTELYHYNVNRRQWRLHESAKFVLILSSHTHMEPYVLQPTVCVYVLLVSHMSCQSHPPWSDDPKIFRKKYKLHGSYYVIFSIHRLLMFLVF
jgi:hypothetical protein